jgi:hypothetical protein
MRQRILLLSICLLLLISFIPTAAALYFRTPGWSWTGILSRNTADVNGYLSIIEEVRQGHLRTHNLFTAEPHPAFQIRPYYSILGLIGRLLPFASNVFLLEVGRFFSLLALLILLAVLIRRIFAEQRDQIFGLLFVVTASGLGWLHLTADPPDLRIVETSTFLAFLSPPLYSVSLSLFIGIILCLETSWRQPEKKWSYGLMACLLALWEGFDRPFLLGPLLGAVAFTTWWFAIFRRRLNEFLFPALLVLLGASLAIGYQAHVVSQIPIYEAWNRQHVVLTPVPARLLLSYGLLLPFAIFGCRSFLQKKPELGTLLAFYLLFSMILSHFPIQFQERFLEGSPLCLSLFAAYGLLQLIHRFSSTRVQTSIAIFIIALFLPSSAVAFFNDIVVLESRRPPQYLPDELLAAIKSLRDLIPQGDAILSAQSSGNFIPAYSGRQVVLGHQVQTAGFFQKLQLVTAVLRTNPASGNSGYMLRASGARWLFWGPEERYLAADVFDPEKSPYCQRKFSNRLARIYRLRFPK